MGKIKDQTWEINWHAEADQKRLSYSRCKEGVGCGGGVWVLEPYGRLFLGAETSLARRDKRSTSSARRSEDLNVFNLDKIFPTVAIVGTFNISHQLNSQLNQHSDCFATYFQWSLALINRVSSQYVTRAT